MADPLEEDIKRPYNPRFDLGLGMSSPESRDRLYESYQITSNPLLEAKKKYKQERLKRRQEKLNFEISKQALKDRQEESRANRDLLKESPDLSNGLSQITEDFKDDPEGGQAALMKFMSDNTLALSKNSALNTQVKLQNSFFERKIAEKKDEEKRTEDLNLRRALTYYELGDKEKSNEYFDQLTSPESIQSFQLGVKLQQQAAAKEAKTVSDAQKQAREEKQTRFSTFVTDFKQAVSDIPVIDPIKFEDPGGETGTTETLFDRIEKSEGRHAIYYGLERSLRLFPEEFEEYQGKDMRDILKGPKGELFLQKAYNKLNVAVSTGMTGTPADPSNPIDTGE